MSSASTLSADGRGNREGGLARRRGDPATADDGGGSRAGSSGQDGGYLSRPYSETNYGDSAGAFDRTYSKDQEDGGGGHQPSAPLPQDGDGGEADGYRVLRQKLKEMDL